MSAVPPSVSASLPISRILYSCSMALTCCSSVTQMAKGTPSMMAVEDTNHSALPANQKLLVPKPVTADTLAEIQPRVVGGTISLSAERRSERDSEVGSYSESVEISESARVRFAVR